MGTPITVQTLFQRTAHEWIEDAQYVAQELLLRRPSITIEDVLELVPRPEYLHRNITGMVFRNEVFKCAGFTKAKHKAARGRIICVWTLKPEYYTAEQLSHRWKRTREEYDFER